jgi:hypothetical protein
MGADDKLYGGTIAEFTDSMAEEIELAYNAVLAENGKNTLPVADPADRRMLFIAISRGVINHLQKKKKAVTVQLPAMPSGQILPVEVAKR